MKILKSALSLTVENVPASSNFLQTHFGFQEKWSSDGFAYLSHEDAGMDIVYLRIGIEVLPENLHDVKAAGVIIAFVVEDIELEGKRLQSEGVTITLPLQEDPWGERLFQITDPNGITIQLVQWVKPSDEQYANNPGGKSF